MAEISALSARCQHDLPGGLAITQQSHGFRDIRKVEPMRYVGLDLAFFEPAKKLGKGLPQQLRPVFLVRTPVKTDDIDIFHQRDIGRDLWNASGGEADNNDAATPGYRAQAGVEDIAAHGIVDHIGASA